VAGGSIVEVVAAVATGVFPQVTRTLLLKVWLISKRQRVAWATTVATQVMRVALSLPLGKVPTTRAVTRTVECPRGTTVLRKEPMACGTHAGGMGHPQLVELLVRHLQGRRLLQLLQLWLLLSPRPPWLRSLNLSSF